MNTTATRKMRRTHTTMQGLLVFDVLRVTAGLAAKIHAAKLRDDAQLLNDLADAALAPAFWEGQDDE